MSRFIRRLSGHRIQHRSMVPLNRMENLEIALTNVALLWLLTVPHEFAHAWTATRLGDDTPSLEGRVTLNPLAHVDWRPQRPGACWVGRACEQRCLRGGARAGCRHGGKLVARSGQLRRARSRTQPLSGFVQSAACAAARRIQTAGRVTSSTIYLQRACPRRVPHTARAHDRHAAGPLDGATQLFRRGGHIQPHSVSFLRPASRYTRTSRRVVLFRRARHTDPKCNAGSEVVAQNQTKRRGRVRVNAGLEFGEPSVAVPYSA
jgi:hypothetical protein